MYSGGYPQTKFTVDAKNMHKSNAKSCGYYWRIIFFFSSLIQSLIIVTLVLFMVYGHPEQSSEEKRVQDLQQSFMQLAAENKLLQQAKGNLTRLLNVTLTQKLKNDQDLQKLRHLANVSRITIINVSNKLAQCDVDKRNIQRGPGACNNNPVITDPISSGKVAQLQAMYRLLQLNFTQTVQQLSRDCEGVSQARDALRLESISLRRNATDLQRQLQVYGERCKSDFVQSLSGIQEVTLAFKERIDGLFPALFPFQLTCEKQREQLQQMRSNCSSLSHDIETKYQGYLDSVVAQVSQIRRQSVELQVQYSRLQDDLRWCQQNRTAERGESGRRSQEEQRKHDGEVERLLKEQKRLRNENELQKQSINLKSSQISLLTNQVLSLNNSLKHCVPKVPSLPPFPPLNFPSLTKPGSSFPSLAKPGMGGTVTNAQGGAVPATGSSFQSDLQKHLKELHDMASKGSGVSG